MGHFLLRSFMYLVNMASYFKIAFLKKKKKKKNIIRVELIVIMFFFFFLECQTPNNATISVHLHLGADGLFIFYFLGPLASTFVWTSLKVALFFYIFGTNVDTNSA
jgi:hypothetical protein